VKFIFLNGGFFDDGMGWTAKKMEVEIDGYGSIPIDTFLVG